MKITFKDIEYKLALTFGFLGTMPIITIGNLTVFSWLTLISVVFFFLSLLKGKRRITKFCLPYLIITLLSVVTAFICNGSNIPQIWKNLQTTGVIWNVLYLILIIYYSSTKNNYLSKAYLKGVYYASIIHMIWGYLQFILYNSAGIKLNDVVFIDLLHMSTESVTQIKSGGIALSGFCWNAGNMAPLLLFGFILTQSIPMKFAFVLASMLSGSRAAILGILSYVIILYIMSPNESKTSKRAWIATIGVFIIGTPILIMTGRIDSIVEALANNFSYFSRETLMMQSSAIIHLRYWTSIFTIAGYAGLIRLLFGFGISSSGYPFTVLYNQYNTSDFGTWGVECDIVNQLWSTGLISLVIRYVWYIKYIKIAYKIDKKMFCFLIAFLIEGLVYNVSFNWAFIMIVAIFTILKKNEVVTDILIEKNSNKGKRFIKYSNDFKGRSHTKNAIENVDFT